VGAAIGELANGEAPGSGCGVGRGGAELRAVVINRHRAAVLGRAGERLGRGVLRGVDIAIHHRAVGRRCRCRWRFIHWRDSIRPAGIDDLLDRGGSEDGVALIRREGEAVGDDGVLPRPAGNGKGSGYVLDREDRASGVRAQDCEVADLSI